MVRRSALLALVGGLALLTLGQTLAAQTTVELLTTATETLPPGSAGYHSGFPINTFYHDQRLQSLYLASDLTAAGITANSTITALQLKATGAPGTSVSSFRIRMQHTTATTALAAFTSTGWTVVYGPTTIASTAFSAGAWYTFSLTTSFVWNGTSNIFIDWSTDGSTWVAGGGCYVRTQTSNRSIYFYQDVGIAWPYDSGGATSHASAPSLRVTYTPGGPSLTTSVTALNLGSTAQGTAGTTQSYTVSGSATTASTTISAPTGVEVSLNQSTWGSSANIPSTGNWGPTTVYARIASTAAAGAVSGNISHTTASATTRNVSVSGNVSQLSATPTSLTGFSTVQGTPSATQSYALTGAGLTGNTVVTPPSGFEVSQSSTGPFTATITITTTPTVNTTIYVRLTGTTVGSYSGNVTNVSGVASVNVAVSGSVNPPNDLNVTRNGPGTSTAVDNDAQGTGNAGLVILDFSLKTNQAAWTVTDITFTESGTADGSTDINFLALYEDSTTGGTAGSFDAADALATAAAGTAFSAANGTYTATLSTSAWAVSTTRRFFLVCKLSGQATAGETIQAEVTALTATTAATPAATTGVPTTAANTALTIDVPKLTVALAGPGAYTAVNNDAQGPNNDGLVLAEVTLTTKNDQFNFTSLTFTASGTADEQADINFLALYQDNGNASWDGPTTDTLATAAAGTGFSAPDGTYTATLSSGTFAMNTTRRYFLVCKLAGTASPGETFRAALTSAAIASPAGPTTTGLPTSASSALQVAAGVLTVSAGTANPGTTSVEQGATGFAHVLAQFRFTASNLPYTVAAITLTTAGTGDWLNDLNATTGVELYEDDGNGSFGAGDTLLFSSGGVAGTMSCTLTTSLSVPMNGSKDVWLVLNVLASAGASLAETFTAQIAATTDVTTSPAGGNVQLGTPTPTGGTLRVIAFAVTGFTPTADLPAGGKPITITGSGFAAPVTLTIGGVACPGTATVNAGGTQITGLTVPAGVGTNLSIVLTTNGLAAKTLTQKFSYSTTAIVTTGKGGGGGGGGCAAAETSSLLWALGAPVLGLLAWRRRRRKA